MKVLKGILAGIGILAALMCALIILSATNPGITEGLSSLLSGDGFPSEEEGESEGEGEESPADAEEDDFVEEPQESLELPDFSDLVDIADTTDTDTEIASEEEEEPQRTVARQPDAPVDDSFEEEPQEEPERVRGTQGYEQPLQSDIKIPTIVTGKNGYEPITEQSEVADGEYKGLTYGELGDVH